MIIDAHTHIHLDGHEGKAVPELLSAMDTAHIEKAAVFAAPINGLSTERVLVEIREHRDRLFAVASVSPFLRDFIRPLNKVEEWLAGGAVHALKFYTGYEHFYPADERIRPYMELLVKYGRPAIFHTGDLYDQIKGAKLKYSHPLHVDDLAAEMPDLKIVIAHMGSPWVVDAAQVCYKNRNVYADCSGFVYGDFSLRQEDRFRDEWGRFDAILEGGASDKILFGTDWPISDIRPYIDVVRKCAGNAEKASRIFSGNAARVFGL